MPAPRRAPASTASSWCRTNSPTRSGSATRYATFIAATAASASRPRGPLAERATVEDRPRRVGDHPRSSASCLREGRTARRWRRAPRIRGPVVERVGVGGEHVHPARAQSRRRPRRAPVGASERAVICTSTPCSTSAPRSSGRSLTVRLRSGWGEREPEAAPRRARAAAPRRIVGQRAVGRLDQQVGAVAAERGRLQLVVVELRRACGVDLGAGAAPRRGGRGAQVGSVSSRARPGSLGEPDAAGGHRADVRRGDQRARARVQPPPRRPRRSRPAWRVRRRGPAARACAGRSRGRSWRTEATMTATAPAPPRAGQQARRLRPVRPRGAARGGLDRLGRRGRSFASPGTRRLLAAGLLLHRRSPARPARSRARPRRRFVLSSPRRRPGTRSRCCGATRRRRARDTNKLLTTWSSGAVFAATPWRAAPPCCSAPGPAPWP